MRVCLVYDCLDPYTIGGAQRWYRQLALAAVAAGHEVTYLTRRQWPDRADPLPGIRVIAVSGPDELYDESGGRLAGPGVAFGRGVLRHLARHRHDYDVVQVGNFPYFSVLAARLALTHSRTRLYVDWHEVLSADYWHDFAGPVRGRAGRLLQRASIAASPTAYCFSRFTAARLRAAGAAPVLLGGLYTPHDSPVSRHEQPPTVVFAGRHIADKRVEVVPEVVRLAREQVPGLRGTILGDGPLRDDVGRRIEALGLRDVIDLSGAVSGERVRQELANATCHLLPSRREGYGMVVIEASSVGTPSVVVAGSDNAATDLVEDGVNGFVSPTADARDIAGLVVAAHQSAAALRRSTSEWFGAHLDEHRIERSIEAVLRAYSLR